MSQGAQANKTGNKLEQFICNMLIQNGYKKVNNKSFDSLAYSDSPIFAEQYHVGKGIYDTNQYCDFILYDKIKHPQTLSIECKWQEKPGSVDEKYPYLVLNIEKRTHDTIILLDGEGYKEGAKRWLQSQASSRQKLKAVYSMSEFMSYANSGKL